MGRPAGIMARRAQTSLERPYTGEEATFSPPALSSFPDIKTRVSPSTSPPPTSKKKDVLDYIYTETYGGVEFYKRMAKRAESAMQLEQKQYQCDLDRSQELIHRLKARISALEVIADEREVALENQRRKVRMLRHQLQYNSKAFERDLNYLRLHAEHADRKLAMTMEESRRKTFELRYEITKKEQALEALQADMSEILKSIEEPLQAFYLPDYFRADSRASPLKKTEGIKNAAKILRMRILYEDLLQDARQKEHESDSLADQVRLWKKEAEEAVKSRDSVLNCLRTYDGVPERIEELDRTLCQSILLKDTDLVLPAPRENPLHTTLDKLEAMLQAFLSKADAAYQGLGALEREKTELAVSVSQLKEDLGLKNEGHNEDVFALLTAVREQIRKKMEQIERLQSENARVSGEMQKCLADLNQQQDSLTSDKDKLSDLLLEEQKIKDELEKKVYTLQSLFKTLSSSLQAGKYDAIFEENTIGSDEADKILSFFKSLATEKTVLHGKVKETQEYILEFLELIHKPERTDDPVENLQFILESVREMKEENQSLAEQLNCAEDKVGESVSHVDTTLRQASQCCGTLRGALVKVQLVLGEQPMPEPAAEEFSATELAQVAQGLTDILPQVVDMKKGLDSTVSTAETLQVQLDRIRQALKGLHSLFPGSENEDVTLIEKVKGELLSAKETKDKAMGRAQSLSLEASLLDPVLTDICGAVMMIEQEIGASPVPFKASGQETSGKAAFIRDRLLELKGLVNAKMRSLLEEIEVHNDKVQLLDNVLKNADRKSADRIELLRSEVLRLGGYDIENKHERTRRTEAVARVREVISRVAKSLDAGINPLSKLAIFQVDLLVNNKVYRQLEVSSNMGGLSQAAIHFFRVEKQSGEVTFENATIPGSQSSNMLVELVINPPAGNSEAYESKAGDILGLAIKVKSSEEQNPREILYNSNVIHTDEVMDAIKGQSLDNFSLWPDLISSWKWEKSPTKGWTLVSIKWRFLLKSVFPELSEPLQILAIANRPAYDKSQTIRTLG